MDLIDMFRTLQSQGIDFLEAISGMSKDDLLACGITNSLAGRWRTLAETFYGPTRSRKQQQACIDAAREAGFSLDALHVIDKNARSLLDGDQWALRLELLALRGTVDEINRAAVAIVRSRNRLVEGADAMAHARRAVKGGKNTDAKGCRNLTIYGPERDIAALRAGWEKSARRLRAADPRLSYEQAMYDAAMSGGRAVETITPHVVVGIGDWAKLLRDDGDDCVFALTDGTTITGAELVAKLMDDHHVVGLYDPVAGPVNLYRSRRLASPKQSALLDAESILCEGPGCTTPATESQNHHIRAWNRGGFTNVRDMTKLCRRCNARNDDDPDAPPRNGRVEREHGRILHRRGDDPPTRNTHPIKNLSAQAIAARQ
ncbi:HNH endonuclease signature motif containing protein [Corynebacterium doosanense]|uniref:HNH endonuclease n=1 Tax=Corynebacterium doosanense CAU 212 = DSM 45436 TaxID=558173 RepID=A0A097II36_9CORY|nr:HNH endonuclease signature motif containing protein [Corynebacterium doosanense]AIT61795.1 HNH endonuclease [Corynebacterium doosanense CAU 212 = DSM 45436]